MATYMTGCGSVTSKPSKFKVGDRVRVTGTSRSNCFESVGKITTITARESSDGWFVDCSRWNPSYNCYVDKRDLELVPELKSYISGMDVPYNFGDLWEASVTTSASMTTENLNKCVESLKSKTKISKMKKLGNMMKKLLDSDTQTLVKARFINGDLEITDTGTRALIEILFTDKKTELVKLAQEQIDEEEKECK